jgi:hypothetical protein
MHCVSLVSLDRLSLFHPPDLGTNSPSCVDVLLNTKKKHILEMLCCLVYLSGKLCFQLHDLLQTR